MISVQQKGDISCTLWTVHEAILETIVRPAKTRFADPLEYLDYKDPEYQRMPFNRTNGHNPIFVGEQHTM